MNDGWNGQTEVHSIKGETANNQNKTRQRQNQIGSAFFSEPIEREREREREREKNKQNPTTMHVDAINRN